MQISQYECLTLRCSPEIVFEPGKARVVHADILGYCGLGVEFAGSYTGDEKRLKEIQEKIESEMKKQDVPADISVVGFLRRPDPQLEQQKRAVAKEFGWTP